MAGRAFDHCFVCGSMNEAGLRLDIVHSNGEASAEFQADACWEGYPGVVHGGVITALLDDLMCHAGNTEGQQLPVTACIEVRFRRPARTGSRLYCMARVKELRGRIIIAAGEIRDREGRLIATAKSKLMVMSQVQMDDFTGVVNDCC